MISLLNAKAILFYVSFFIQFVATDYSYPALSFLLLGTIMQVCSMFYLSLLIIGARYLARQLMQHQRTAAIASGIVGLLFIGFGLKLAISGL